MHERFEPIMSVNLLDGQQREAIHKLRNLAIENDVVCMQAPNIWDADTQTDANLAKANCLGLYEGEKVRDACPIIDICGATALLLNDKHGVWGGMTPRDRQRLRKKI